MAPPEAQSWRDARAGGDSSVSTARWSPSSSHCSSVWCGLASHGVFPHVSGNDALAGNGHVGRACQGRGTLPWLTFQASLETVCSPGLGGSLSSSSLFPAPASFARHTVLTEPGPGWGQEGSYSVLQGGASAHPSLPSGVRVHALVSTGGPLPVGAGGAAGCMGVRAKSRARCYVRARLSALCVTCARTSRGVIHSTMQ